MDRAHDRPVSHPFGSLYVLRSSEAAFLRSLGIERLPKTLPHSEEVFLGEVRVKPAGSAKIYVVAMPARFWRVEITTCQGKRVRLNTGSGDLKPRWGVVAEIASADVTVSLPEDPEEELPLVSLGQGTSHTEIKPSDLLPPGSSGCHSNKE